MKDLQIEVQCYYIFKVGDKKRKINADQERRERKREYLDIRIT